MPPALLLAALALLLASVPVSTARRAVVVALLVAGLAYVAAVHWPAPVGPVLFALWASVVVTALGTYLPRPPWPLAYAAAANAGLWSGISVAVAGRPADLGIALAGLLLIVPARLAVTRGWGIAAKVVASWLLAVAILAALLPTVPTPGYMPDHMD